MNGGDILALQRILGHSDLKVTMRYAHLAPDYMEAVPRLAPVNFGESGKILVSDKKRLAGANPLTFPVYGS